MKLNFRALKTRRRTLHLIALIFTLTRFESVMSKQYKIVILPGDGIGVLHPLLLLIQLKSWAGPEVTAEAIKVLLAIESARKGALSFDIKSLDFGGIAIDNAGNPLPGETLEACKKSDAIILGAYPYQH